MLQDIHVQSPDIEIVIQLIGISLAAAGYITFIPLPQLGRILFYTFVTVGELVESGAQ